MNITAEKIRKLAGIRKENEKGSEMAGSPKPNEEELTKRIIGSLEKIIEENASPPRCFNRVMVEPFFSIPRVEHPTEVENAVMDLVGNELSSAGFKWEWERLDNRVVLTVRWGFEP